MNTLIGLAVAALVMLAAHPPIDDVSIGLRQAPEQEAWVAVPLPVGPLRVEAAITWARGVGATRKSATPALTSAPRWTCRVAAATSSSRTTR